MRHYFYITSPSALTPPTASARLLLVEDDVDFRQRVARAMERRGYTVSVAANVEDGLTVARLENPTHALVDLRMPGGSGLELIRHLRKAYPGLRIVVLTGYGSIPTTVEALRLGADDFLTKPVDAREIHQALLGVERPPAREIPIPSLARVEWEHLQRVLRDCNHNISQAARKLGIERRTLQRKMKKYPPEN